MSFQRVLITPFVSMPPLEPEPAPPPPKPEPAATTAPPPPQRPALPRIDAWQAATGQRETTARLNQLPPGLDFVDGFSEPIRYDAVRRLLVYRGFMSSGTYADLRRLSIDAAYLEALDDLYVGTSLPAGAGRSRRLLLALAGVALLAGMWWLLR